MKIERYQVRGQTKYRFRAYVGVDPLTGDKIRIRGSGYDSKREAQLACAEMMANKAPSKVHDVTYRQMYELWLESYRLKVKASTLRNTEQVFRDHILPAFGSHKVPSWGENGV
ncbi:MAG: Arm DNA-binding domain-containing protein [Mobilibacterium timonense]|uniref:N-terminal phage integrase SAM-like domain-containing protein n=1 Tax=Mobilibacterium timonense TaxID=1871012 RepID=UPI0023570AA1|nr:N-terminal phage integrase SAM-like domain-containing protein [Mobilibacterium timonense]MBM6991413.1 Arm DNA-binding domain-containing protein [Mobilibacterium timonense]